MNMITVIGTGYVGLVAGACLADMGNTVVCADNNEMKIDQLKLGNLPIYELGLEEVVRKNIEASRLTFTSNTEDAVKMSRIIFIAVGTPPLEDGSADIKHVLQVCEDIGRYMNDNKLVVVKSTVPVGTGQKAKQTISRMLNQRGVPWSFDIVSNPEFLREGCAINDFVNPDRIVIGAESPEAKAMMTEVYGQQLAKGVPFLMTNLQTSELIKYASNAFLAMKVTYINEMAQLCEKVGADVIELAQGIGMDKRIGRDFLKPGPGYGGSCFPKDTRAIVKTAMDQGVDLSLIRRTVEANETHKLWIVEKISAALHHLEGRTIGILGLTFKAETDDMREAPALTIVKSLADSGAKLKIFDPCVNQEEQWRLKSIEQSIKMCGSEYDVAKGSEALVVITDWNQFKQMDLVKIHGLMKQPIIFDLRNIFDRSDIEAKGFTYFGIGRSS